MRHSVAVDAPRLEVDRAVTGVDQPHEVAGSVLVDVGDDRVVGGSLGEHRRPGRVRHGGHRRIGRAWREQRRAGEEEDE